MKALLEQKAVTKLTWFNLFNQADHRHMGILHSHSYKVKSNGIVCMYFRAMAAQGVMENLRW